MLSTSNLQRSCLTCPKDINLMLASLTRSSAAINYKRNMNILVTGSNGQLGHSLRDIAADSANRYIFTDVAELDITDKSAIIRMMETENINLVINCAAYTNVDKAEDDFDTANLINNTAVRNLAEACKQFGATFIHVSTDYIFDGSGNIPYTEDMPLAPLGVYGVTKLHGEQAVLESGCDYIIIRTSWLYSEYGKNFVKTMMMLTEQRDNLNVVFDQAGTPTYAGDLARAIYNIVENNKYSGNNGIYHFSNEGVCSWYDFAHEISELARTECDIRPCHSNEFPSKVNRPHYSVLDKTKIKTTFGLTIPYWKDSLRVCISNLQ